MMNKLYIICSLVFLLMLDVSFAQAQEVIENTEGLTKKEQKSLKKEQKQKAKEQKEKEEEALKMAEFEMAKQSLSDTTFILKANYLFTRRGNMIPVADVTNFLYVNGEKATIQLAFTGLMAPTPNGIGGITLDGRISDIEMTESKNGSITYRFNVMGPALMSNVIIQIPNGSNVATARVSSNVTGGRIEFRGTLVPLDKNAIYEGMKTF